MTLSEVMVANHIISILIVSIIVTFFSTIAQKYLTNQEHLRSLKNRQKEIQKELKNTKEPSIMKELNAEMLKISGSMFKSSFKPIFVTLVPFLLLFAWLRGIYTPTIGSSWIWWYLGFSIISSMIIRKMMKVV